MGQIFWHESAFSHVAQFIWQAFLGQTFWHEAAFSHVAQSIWQESAISQTAWQQAPAATHSVLALSHVVSLALLLQHELMVRAATATNANNTFFIFFVILGS